MKNILLSKVRHLPKIQFTIQDDSVEISIIENTQEQTQPASRTVSPDDYIELGKHFQVRKNEFEESYRFYSSDLAEFKKMQAEIMEKLEKKAL
jgi:dimeric dUTPase (all-alpha-NTP-PPase superfamily)